MHGARVYHAMQFLLRSALDVFKRTTAVAVTPPPPRVLYRRHPIREQTDLST